MYYFVFNVSDFFNENNLKKNKSNMQVKRISKIKSRQTFFALDTLSFGDVHNRILFK